MNSSMPKELKEKWVTALRSGEYQQGQNYLHVESNNSYCCLGVLQHCIDGKCEMSVKSNNIVSAGELPTKEWAENHNIKFNGMSYGNGNSNQSQEYVYPELYVKDDNGTIEYETAYNLNDVWKMSFSQIADLIEEQVEGV
jgi:hypothetical protein